MTLENAYLYIFLHLMLVINVGTMVAEVGEQAFQMTVGGTAGFTKRMRVKGQSFGMLAKTTMKDFVGSTWQGDVSCWSFRRMKMPHNFEHSGLQV